MKRYFEELIPYDSKVIHLGSLLYKLCQPSGFTFQHLMTKLGTGNSTLPDDMSMAGYQSQIAVDYSSVVIESMSQRSHKAGLQFQQADVFKLDELYNVGSFDVAIDKGTLDAFLTNKRDQVSHAIALLSSGTV